MAPPLRFPPTLASGVGRESHRRHGLGRWKPPFGLWSSTDGADWQSLTIAGDPGAADGVLGDTDFFGCRAACFAFRRPESGTEPPAPDRWRPPRASRRRPCPRCRARSRPPRPQPGRVDCSPAQPRPVAPRASRMARRVPGDGRCERLERHARCLGFSRRGSWTPLPSATSATPRDSGGVLPRPDPGGRRRRSRQHFGLAVERRPDVAAERRAAPADEHGIDSRQCGRRHRAHGRRQGRLHH